MAGIEQHDKKNDAILPVVNHSESSVHAEAYAFNMPAPTDRVSPTDNFTIGNLTDSHFPPKDATQIAATYGDFVTRLPETSSNQNIVSKQDILNTLAWYQEKAIDPSIAAFHKDIQSRLTATA